MTKGGITRVYVLCRFFEQKPEKASPEENDFAKNTAWLYFHNCCGNIDALKHVTDIDWPANPNKLHTKACVLELFKAIDVMTMKEIYKDYARTQEKEIIKTMNDSDIYRMDYPLVYRCCKKCGAKYVSHVDEVASGFECPHCDHFISPEDYYKRIVSKRTKGEYEFIAFKDNKNQVMVRHKGCKRIICIPFMYNLLVTGTYECPVCKKLSHEGERK